MDDQNMKKAETNKNSPKTLRLYAIVFLSIAIALLVLAAFFQNRAAQHLDYYKAELEQKTDTLTNNQTMLKNMQTENEYLKKKMEEADAADKKKNSLLSQKEQEKHALTQALAKAETETKTLEQLARVQSLLLQGKWTKAREAFNLLEPKGFSEQSQAIYDALQEIFS